MSAIYDLLDDFCDEYHTHKTEEETRCLQRAVNQLESALEDPSLPQRLEGLRLAAKLAKELGDRPLCLLFDFFLASELIGTANDMIEGLAVLEPAAMESRSAEYDLKAQRIGLNNLLASAYSLVDPFGFSREIQEAGLLLESSPLTDNEDLCVGLGAKYEVEVTSGNHLAAKQVRDEIWAHARMLDDPLYYLHASTFDCDLAFLEQDWPGMVAAASSCLQIVAESQDASLPDGSAQGGDQLDLENDMDFRVVMAAQACGLAKLGCGQKIVHLEKSNSDSCVPAPARFFVFWAECHLALGDHSTAIKLAIESWHEVTGKGQHYREVQALCLVIRCSLAAESKQDVKAWVDLAQAAASQLRDPLPALQQIQALL